MPIRFQKSAKLLYFWSCQWILINQTSDDDKAKTAFTTYRSLYQFKRVSFGLANSPATVERLMEIVLSGLRWQMCCHDDVITVGKTFQETLDNLRMVITRPFAANLKLKPKKCSLFEDEVAYLGHVVSVPSCKTEGKAFLHWPTSLSMVLFPES